MEYRSLREVLKELDPTPSTSGSLIRVIRRNFEITLKELEMLTGIQVPNLSAIENNKIEAGASDIYIMYSDNDNQKEFREALLKYYITHYLPEDK
jgi:transcriptional regulator with XRE-family HTH domain